MSKKFTMTLLSSSLGGLLLGISSGVLAAQELPPIKDSGLPFYSVPKEADASRYNYGSTYRIYYNKSSGWGTMRYVLGGKDVTLFNFDQEGNIIVLSKDNSIAYTVHEPVLKDFARMAAGLRTSGTENGKHQVDEKEVRRIFNKVNNLSNTIINPEILKQSAFIASGPRPKDGRLVQASAAGEFALAVGTGASAAGEFALAVGTEASADEKFATSVGSWSAALGQQSVALGVGAYAYANASTAAGTAAYVDGSAIYGTAIGNYAKVDKNATEGTALGAKATVTNKNSVALGANSRTTRDNEVYIGYEAEPGKAYKTRVLGGLSDGTRPSDAATVRQVDRVKDSVEQLAQDTNTRLVVEAKKSREYTDSRTTVGVNPDGKLTRAEGATKTIAVNDGLVALSSRTDRIDYAVGSVDRRVTKNTQAIQSNTRQLQEHNARLNSQQRQIRENHEEMKRAAAQSAALAGLFQPYSVGKFNATAALGGYSDKQAVAVGVGYRFNEQTAAKAGIAASDGDVSYNMGVNFEF
ncbi:Immunoglobulin-binding protein from prophage P-EibD [Escherichia coli]|uniref:Immunoglobulin-binding protein from prophage P-EibD n=6 Tax=Escherichia coli TaxID=562 RepID=A0A376W6N4_ECOLX|nr:Immunoglobulin-binding protein from prophage P-EibD [Escherichia coli]